MKNNRIMGADWHDVLKFADMRKRNGNAYMEWMRLSDITIYVDEEGLLIQRYCPDELDCKLDAVRSMVLKKLNHIHNLNYHIEVRADVCKRFSALADEMAIASINDIRTTIHGFQDELKNDRIVFSHGDFHPGNIVFDGRKVYFIDWEYMCMTYETYDVCRFLYYSQIDEYCTDSKLYEDNMTVLYKSLDKFLAMYYGRLPDRMELKRAKEMLFLCEGIELLLRIKRHQNNVQQMIRTIECHKGFLEEDVK